jgi:hypothetical protein
MRSLGHRLACKGCAAWRPLDSPAHPQPTIAFIPAPPFHPTAALGKHVAAMAWIEPWSLSTMSRRLTIHLPPGNDLGTGSHASQGSLMCAQSLRHPVPPYADLDAALCYTPTC